MQNVRVRFPPSPTGFCHVGTARMAVLNYLFAKRYGGVIIFRSEDTDKERSKKEFEEDIIEQLHWLGLSWDEFYRDTELLGTHAAALKRLIDADQAYISREESKKETGKEVDVVRLRNPGSSVTFTDVVRGEITFDTKELGDFVIARAIDDPLYNFSVVVNDGEEGITHVIRGEDHISNTPRQILIQEALGYARPTYAHFPLLLSTDRSKLSKRTGDVAVKNYRETGYLAPALLNYIALLGWTPPSEREIMSLEEMAAEFDLSDLHKSGAIFDIEKLRWYNRHYISLLTPDDFRERALSSLKDSLALRELAWDAHVASKLVPLLRERVSVWSDVLEFVQAGEYDFFFVEPSLDVAKLPENGGSAQEALRHLTAVHEMLSVADEEMYRDAERLKNIVWDYATSEGRGKVLWPLRYALSGREKSPDPFLIASVIGRERVLARIAAAKILLAV